MPRYDEELELEVDVDLEDEGSSFAPFLFGVLVGAGAALLLAPRTGAEMRADLGRLIGRFQDAGPAGAVEGARSSASGWVDRARGAVESQIDRVREAVDEGRATARQTGDELRRSLDEAKAAYRAGVAGTPPPKPSPRAPAPPASGARVVVTDVAVEEDRGDLAR